MKKLALLLVVAMLLGCMGTLSGCNKNNNNNSNNESEEQTRPKEEIELENALRLEKEGAFGGAKDLLADLINRGYYLEYTEKQQELNRKFQISQAIRHAVKKLKKSLKDPNSLVVYSISISADEYQPDSYCFRLNIDYGAANSFGGMVRDTYETSYSIDVAEYYIGKYINSSYVNLNDAVKMTDDEWDDKLWGDFILYSYRYRERASDNIWNN